MYLFWMAGSTKEEQQQLREAAVQKGVYSSDKGDGAGRLQWSPGIRAAVQVWGSWSTPGSSERSETEKSVFRVGLKGIWGSLLPAALLSFRGSCPLCWTSSFCHPPVFPSHGCLGAELITTGVPQLLQGHLSSSRSSRRAGETGIIHQEQGTPGISLRNISQEYLPGVSPRNISQEYLISHDGCIYWWKTLREKDFTKWQQGTISWNFNSSNH